VRRSTTSQECSPTRRSARNMTTVDDPIAGVLSMPGNRSSSTAVPIRRRARPHPSSTRTARRFRELEREDG
jgi:hypothetical protein